MPSRSLTFLKRKNGEVAGSARASPRDGQAHHQAASNDGAMAASREACSHGAPLSPSLQAGTEGPGDRRDAPSPLIKRCWSAINMMGNTTITSPGCRTSIHRLPSNLPSTPPCSAPAVHAGNNSASEFLLEHAMAALHSVASLQQAEEAEATCALLMMTGDLISQAGSTVGGASHTEYGDGGRLPSVEALEAMLLKAGSRTGSRRSTLLATGSAVGAAPMHMCSSLSACSLQLQHHAPLPEQAAGTGCGGTAAAAAAPALTRGSPSSWQYHELRCSPIIDPASGARMLVVVQSDVTARVLAERQLAHMLEAEHSLLESIFPLHVLEHAVMLSGAPGGACPADGMRMGTRPIGDMLPALADASSLATAHEDVTLLFADIVGASEHTFGAPQAASDSHTWPH